MRRFLLLVALTLTALGLGASPAFAGNNVYAWWINAPVLNVPGGAIYTAGGIQASGNITGCPEVQFQVGIYADGFLVATEPATRTCYQPPNDIEDHEGWTCPLSGVHNYQINIEYWVNWYPSGWGGGHLIGFSAGTVGACR